MTEWISKPGIITAGVYLALSLYFISTQGLAGESFIAIVLGIPWSFVLALVEYGSAQGPILTVLLLTPIALNALILYWFAATISTALSRLP